MHKNMRYDYKIVVHLGHLGTDGVQIVEIK